jgi:hypothetical protein
MPFFLAKAVDRIQSFGFYYTNAFTDTHARHGISREAAYILYRRRAPQSYVASRFGELAHQVLSIRFARESVEIATDNRLIKGGIRV